MVNIQNVNYILVYVIWNSLFCSSTYSAFIDMRAEIWNSKTDHAYESPQKIYYAIWNTLDP